MPSSGMKNGAYQPKSKAIHAFSTCVLLVLCCMAHVGSQAADFSVASIKETSQAYGYVLGQEFTLNRLARQYPDIALKADLARSQFASTFPSITSKLESQLKLALGAQKFEEVRTGMESKLQETLAKQSLSRYDADAFFSQVKARSKGDIESPILENLLYINYLSNPAGEFSDGYRQRFQTDGSGKAQGIKLKLQIPRSWAATDGERPHIVQKWTSRNHNPAQIIHLDIRDADGYAPSKKEIERFVQSGEVKDVVVEGATYVDSGNFTLEKQSGFWIQMNMSQDRASRKFYQEAVMYQLFFKGKGIGIMCSAIGPDDDRGKTGEAFKQLRPVCQQVLNSLVLLQAY